MKILVEHLTELPEERCYRPPSAWWSRWMPDSTLPIDAPRFDFEVRRVGRDVWLEGRMSAAVELECSRCLERYRHALQDEYRLRIEPVGERQPPDPEGVRALQQHGLYLSDDLELGWFRGMEFEVDAFFAERVALAMPMKPLCRDSCEGLCPQCGARRDRERCACRDLKPNSPFAVLATLVGGTEGED